MMVVLKTDMGLMFQKYTSEGCEISEPNVIGLAEDVETAWLARKLRNTQTVWDGKTDGAKLFFAVANFE